MSNGKQVPYPDPRCEHVVYPLWKVLYYFLKHVFTQSETLYVKYSYRKYYKRFSGLYKKLKYHKVTTFSVSVSYWVRCCMLTSFDSYEEKCQMCLYEGLDLNHLNTTTWDPSWRCTGSSTSSGPIDPLKGSKRGQNRRFGRYWVVVNATTRARG